MDCDQLKLRFMDSVGSEFECHEVSAGHQVVMCHFIRLDGDFIEVHVIDQADSSVLITDLGEGFRDLANNDVDALDSERRVEIVRQVGSLLGVEQDLGRFQLRVTPDEVGSGLLRVFKALSFIGDLTFTSYPREESEFRSLVEDVLKPIGHLPGRFEKHVSFKSSSFSKREYYADFYVYVVRDVWIDAITAASVSSFANQVNKTHTMWSDVDPKLTVRKMTLLDDTSPFMERESVSLLEKVSDVQFWSKADEFRRRVIELTGRTG